MRLSSAACLACRGAVVFVLALFPFLLLSGSCPGLCQSTSLWCPSQYIAGLCPGGTNIECCEIPTPGCNGQCQDNSLPCAGGYAAGECPGAANIQCCLNSAPPFGSQYGIDISSYVSVTSFQCLSSQGYSFVVPRIFSEGGGGTCDGIGISSWKNALAAGLSPSGYIFPNPGSMKSGHLTPQQQVDMAIYCVAMNGLSDKILWLDIEIDPNDPWSDCHTNEDWIVEMLGTLWQVSDLAGLYTSRGEWPEIACGVDSFSRKLEKKKQEVSRAKLSAPPKWPAHVAKPEFFANQNLTVPKPRELTGNKTLLFWWAQWDGLPNFDNWQAFGPFKSPWMKQYVGDTTRCGISVDLNWCWL